jgi:predicted component of type VI protein secretion system
MTLEDKAWRLTNLSATNPVSVNGTPLPSDNGSVVLRDGDRVELGEVVFRFRAK